jgi:hypothetical protein
MKKQRKIIGNIIIFCIVFIVLLLSVHGISGNPTSIDLNQPSWKGNGPFELSPERGRFALLYSLVEDHTLNHSVALARFTTPDLGYHNNHYVSLFAPTVSLLGIPGYVFGKYFGLSQVGTFAWISLFALANVILIRLIAIRLGAHPLAALIASITFLFATPAFAYAVALYEHHVSTCIILLGFYLLIRYNTLSSLAAIWFLYAFSFTVDYPNIFLMLPIAVGAFFKNVAISETSQKIVLKFSVVKLFLMTMFFIPIFALLFYNATYYGNPLKLSGTVAGVIEVKSDGTPKQYGDVESKKTPIDKPSEIQQTDNIFTMFKPRNMINGLYILLISPDRGTLVFTPVMLLGIVGYVLAQRRKVKGISLLLVSIGLTLFLYAMWGDPYGGWAFGARYMIPVYAILSLFIALALTYWQKYRLFLACFFVLFLYSLCVNTLGALTSNSNPPKIQAEYLSHQTHKIVDYTYKKNYILLEEGSSKTYFYQVFASHFMSLRMYYSFILLLIIATIGGALYVYRFGKGDFHEK